MFDTPNKLSALAKQSPHKVGDMPFFQPNSNLMSLVPLKSCPAYYTSHSLDILT